MSENLEFIVKTMADYEVLLKKSSMAEDSPLGFKFRGVMLADGTRAKSDTITDEVRVNKDRTIDQILEDAAKAESPEYAAAKARSLAISQQASDKVAAQFKTERSVQRRQQVGDLNVEAPYGTLQHEYRLQAAIEQRAGKDYGWSEAEKTYLKDFQSKHTDLMRQRQPERDAIAAKERSRSAVFWNEFIDHCASSQQLDKACFTTIRTMQQPGQNRVSPEIIARTYEIWGDLSQMRVR